MQFGPYSWHQWRKAKPTKEAYKKHKPGNMKGAHLYAPGRKYIEFGKLIFHDSFSLLFAKCVKEGKPVNQYMVGG
jgi:hypothetical protein